MTVPPADLALRKKWLEQRIEQLLGALMPGRNRVGIAVLDLDNGQLLYGKNAELPVNIASNVKLFTTAAALTLLGPVIWIVGGDLIRRAKYIFRFDAEHTYAYLGSVVESLVFWSVLLFVVSRRRGLLPVSQAVSSGYTSGSNITE